MGAGKDAGYRGSDAANTLRLESSSDETSASSEDIVGVKATAGGKGAGLVVIIPESQLQLGPANPPRWYSPMRLMALFCYIIFICYLDIGLFASNGVTGTEAADGSVAHPGIKQAFNLSDTKLGLLPTLFMIGLMIASGVLTVLANHFNAFRLIGAGMGVWCLGSLLTGASQEFYSLMLGRILVGAGEASIMMLAGPFIDDVAPKEHRTLYLSILSVFPPFGQAAGYMGGNLVKLVEWRVLFFIMASLAVPVILFSLLAPSIDLKGASSQTWDPEHAPEEIAELGKRATIVAALKEAWNDLRILHRHPVFVTSIWGYVPVHAVLGSMSFWGPKAAMQIFQVPSGRVDFVIGVVTVLSSIVGIVGGGFALDKMGATLRKGMVMSVIGSSCAMVLMVCAFALVPQINLFFAVFALGLLGIFVTASPLYAISLWSVPIPQRAASQACRTILHHLLGDVPSPAIVGAIQDRVHNWRATMAGLSLILSLAILVYGIGILYAKGAPDYRVFETDDEKDMQKIAPKRDTAKSDLPYVTKRDV